MACLITEEQEKYPASIFILAVTSIALLFLFIKRSAIQTGPLPPGPFDLPIVGYLPFIGSDLHKEFAKLSQLYGSIYKLRLGSKLCMVISSPSLVKEIVRDQDVIFANRDISLVSRALSRGGNDIAFSDYGPEWKNLRKIFVREMMSNASLDNSYDLRKGEMRKAIREVYTNKIGKPVDVGDLIFRTNMSSIMSVVWGVTLEGEQGLKVGTQFKKLFSELVVLMAKPNISDCFPILAKFDLQGIERQAKKLLVVIDKFLDEAIERCWSLMESSEGVKREGNDRKDLMTLLLELTTHEDSDTSISMTQLKAMLTDIVIGGSDTTSTIIEWTMTVLMYHPETMEQVHNELEEVVGFDNAVEQFHLPKLQYLEAAVKEASRLHPAAPFLVPRRPSKTTSVGGYTIPENSTILLNVYALHRHPQIWENPVEFRPQRFLNARGMDFSGNNFQYLPFGSGRRRCPGLPLAEKMLIYQLASLLHSFTWELPADSSIDLSDEFGIVVKKKEPLICIPTPRLLNSDLYHN